MAVTLGNNSIPFPLSVFAEDGRCVRVKAEEIVSIHFSQNFFNWDSNVWPLYTYMN